MHDLSIIPSFQWTSYHFLPFIEFLTNCSHKPCRVMWKLLKCWPTFTNGCQHLKHQPKLEWVCKKFWSVLVMNWLFAINSKWTSLNCLFAILSSLIYSSTHKSNQYWLIAHKFLNDLNMNWSTSENCCNNHILDFKLRYKCTSTCKII